MIIEEIYHFPDFLMLTVHLGVGKRALRRAGGISSNEHMQNDFETTTEVGHLIHKCKKCRGFELRNSIYTGNRFT